MSIHTCRTSLANMTKELSLQWRAAHETWRDEKALEFEQAYMEELMTHLHSGLEAMGKLDKLLTKVRKDCE
ncbi:MAG: hypothetical protein EOM20_15210 [Spartobacteria bacterium]|nr:hypothetical protein [Spartobacteria bacterium]